MELEKLIERNGTGTEGIYVNIYNNYSEISYSIDQIKGIAQEGKEKEKKPRKKAEPKEKFTTDHLIQNKGIPLLIKKGRQLYFRDTKSIVSLWIIEFLSSSWRNQIVLWQCIENGRKTTTVLSVLKTFCHEYCIFVFHNELDSSTHTEDGITSYDE